MDDQPELWKEIKEKGHAAMIEYRVETAATSAVSRFCKTWNRIIKFQPSGAQHPTS